jgi:hypothetical protein
MAQCFFSLGFENRVHNKQKKKRTCGGSNGWDNPASNQLGLQLGNFANFIATCSANITNKTKKPPRI